MLAIEDTEGVLEGSPGIVRLLAGEEIEGGGGSDSTKPGCLDFSECFGFQAISKRLLLQIGHQQ